MTNQSKPMELIDKQEAIRIVADFDDWLWCKCSECCADAGSHAVDTTESLVRLVESLRSLPSVTETERELELERRLRIPFGTLPCAQCGGPHDFDTSIPSELWNHVIRAKGLPEYLCTTCIVREFVRAGTSFTANLWSEEFHGTPISVTVPTVTEGVGIADDSDFTCSHGEKVLSCHEQNKVEDEEQNNLGEAG